MLSLQIFTLMKLPIKEEPIAPAAIQRGEDAVAGVARRVQVEDKKKWWRFENPGCNISTKNKYSQRKSITTLLKVFHKESLKSLFHSFFEPVRCQNHPLFIFV